MTVIDTLGDLLMTRTGTLLFCVFVIALFSGYLIGLFVHHYWGEPNTPDDDDWDWDVPDFPPWLSDDERSEAP